MAKLTLIPWEPTWLDHQTLDLHAIYRRPQRLRDPIRDTWDIQRDDEGFILWDYVGPMSIRNHNRFRQKGMEYVTLGRAEDVLQAASPSIGEKGATPLGRGNRDPRETAEMYIRQESGVMGPWNAAAYFEDVAEERAARIKRIRENVIENGPEMAELFERQTDPGYRLPEKYRAVAKAADETPEPPKRKRGRPRKVQPVAEEVSA